MSPVCDVPRCPNPGTVPVRDVARNVWRFCPACVERHAGIAEANGAPGYQPVDESDPAAQLPLGA
jgi:hypothetical protein